MMCPRSRALLRLLGGELDADGSRDLQGHLEVCPDCRAAHKDWGASWDALGEWELTESDIDFSGPVLAEVDAELRRSVPAARLRLRWNVLRRTAASIAAAVLLGVGAGHLVPVRSTPEADRPLVDCKTMSEAVEWIGLATGSATGLPDSVHLTRTRGGGVTP
ncbi:MAG: hypothetical protein GY842_09165 [bacterium]|nr:hypothetical protein [bacterium]